jgi:hypothetical protein
VDDGDPDLEEEEEVILAGPLADDEAEADPLDIDIDIDIDEDELADIDILELDMLELDIMLEFADELALELADTVGIAAKLADPPPIVENGVHCDVGPAGWGAGVVGSPCRNVDPE